jgi:AcrR family transcriptional regulator
VAKARLVPPLLLAGEDLPPKPVQQRSIEKRARLERAALTLFAKHGYEGTSIDDIAERAGLAAGGFYLHFRSKRQLLLSLMDELLGQLAALKLELPESAEIDPKAALRGLLEAAFTTDLAFLGAYRAWQDAIRSNPDLMRRERAIRGWTVARVEGVLRAVTQRERARSDVDIVALARLLDSLFWSFLAEAPRLPATAIREWIETTTHVIYHALLADPAPASL